MRAALGFLFYAPAAEEPRLAVRGTALFPGDFRPSLAQEQILSARPETLTCCLPGHCGGCSGVVLRDLRLMFGVFWNCAQDVVRGAQGVASLTQEQHLSARPDLDVLPASWVEAPLSLARLCQESTASRIR